MYSFLLIVKLFMASGLVVFTSYIEKVSPVKNPCGKFT